MAWGASRVGERLHYIAYTALMMTVIIASTTSAASTYTRRPDCPGSCGDIAIEYPFGIGDGCYRDEGFNITCDYSTNPPRANLTTSNIQLQYINITSGESVVYKKITYHCFKGLNQTSMDNDWASIQLGDLYLFSHRRNKFLVLGCYTFAYILGVQGKNNSYTSGCASFCESLNGTTGDGGACNGLGCCATAIPAGLNYYEVQWNYKQNPAWKFNPCSYAVLVEEDWYRFKVEDLTGDKFLTKNDNRRVSIILDWAIRANGTCLKSGKENSTYPACLSKKSNCYNSSNGAGYLCQCLPGYEGNPYIPDGCHDIDECDDPAIYPCKLGKCKNTDGGYECPCQKGFRGDGKAGNCTEIIPKPAQVAIECIASVAILVGLFFLVATYCQHRRYMREKREYQTYYEMMGNQLRVFSRKQIEIATNCYNETQVIGKGGQGKVYKGYLENNLVVAIKKAKEVEENKRGQFVNEIVLLSEINHKNIVRLLGCCLEVKIPMLVYEYVPNNSLFDLLHNHGSGRGPIPLGTRLKIALGSAIALDYLHSYVNNSIIHGDVKSANILLDVDYTAKVSDFGASSVLPVDQIVELDHYTPGYVDLERLYTRILTKSSDVYSFGVVMLELVTRKEPIYVDEKRRNQALATCFLSKAMKNEQREMLDEEILTNDINAVEVLDEICQLIVQCLSPKGEDRPTMRCVAEELQKLARFYDRLANQQHDGEETDSLIRDTNSSYISNAVLEIETR